MERGPKLILACLGIVLGAASLVVGLFYAADERNRLYFAWPQEIESGSKLGVRIGAPETDARAALVRHGFRYSHSNAGGDCEALEAPWNARLDYYADDTWRHGSVCVRIQDGRVTQLGWFYVLPISTF
jgi:hypothetical protein